MDGHGLKMGQGGTLDGDTLIAMTGRVYVRCTAAGGAIPAVELAASSPLENLSMPHSKTQSIDSFRGIRSSNPPESWLARAATVTLSALQAVITRVFVCRACLAALLLLVMSFPVMAQQPNNTNGAKRPFYIYGYNSNVPSFVEWDVTEGANALHADIDVLPGGDPRTISHMATWNSDVPGEPDWPFTAWLDYVNLEMVKAQNNTPGNIREFNNLALIVFDCKSDVCVAGNGPNLMGIIRQLLNQGLNTPVKILLSCGSTEDANRLFQGFELPGNALRSNEGLCVDGPAMTSPFTIRNFFDSTPYGDFSNVGAAGGVFLYAETRTTNLLRLIDKAVYIRTRGQLDLAPYAFPINNGFDRDYFVDAGVDGIIASTRQLPGPQPTPQVFALPYVSDLKAHIQTRDDVRMGTRADPLRHDLYTQAYTLRIKTHDDGAFPNSGTDSDLEFRLVGTNGQSSWVTYHGDHPNPTPPPLPGGWISTTRLESGEVDYVTIYSRDLGPLSHIEVTNHDNGTGGDDWDVDSITVSSARWLIEEYHWTTSTPDDGRTIEGDSTSERLNLSLPPATQYATGCGVLISDGTQLQPWSGLASAYDGVRSGGVVYLSGIADCGIFPGNGSIYNYGGNFLDKPATIRVDPLRPGPVMIQRR